MAEDLRRQKLELELEEKELEAKEFVESYSPLKRNILIAMVILIIPAFYAVKYLTAAIYMHNFNKSAINVHPATFTSLPVSIVETKLLPLSATNYSAYALVKNQNPDLVEPNLKYNFNFLDAAGNKIGSASGRDILLAGQIKYLIISNVTLAKTPVSVQLDIPGQTWQKRFEIPNVVLDGGLPSHNDQQSPPGFVVDGNFRNNSGFTLGAVNIKAIVHDKNGAVIAVSQRLENVVSSQQLRGYHFYWPLFLQGSVGRVEINVETDLLDPNNLK